MGGWAVGRIADGGWWIADHGSETSVTVRVRQKQALLLLRLLLLLLLLTMVMLLLLLLSTAITLIDCGNNNVFIGVNTHKNYTLSSLPYSLKGLGVVVVVV